jgi:hypothetical protein
MLKYRVVDSASAVAVLTTVEGSDESELQRTGVAGARHGELPRER